MIARSPARTRSRGLLHRPDGDDAVTNRIEQASSAAGARAQMPAMPEVIIALNQSEEKDGNDDTSKVSEGNSRV